MRFLNKICGATLIEVVVVMTITGIVFTMAAWAFLNFTQYMTTYRKEESHNAIIGAFADAFYWDLNRFPHVEAEGAKIIFLDKDNHAMVLYDVYTDGIVRHQQNHLDTFYMDISNARIQLLDPEKLLFKSLKLDINLGSFNHQFVFHKSYTARGKYYLHGD